ncbi:hypothetical protein COCMIDRAFT_29874 [Bipolaris oryzae ATCC 44560]|uniref:60S ribosomal protein L20 n=1 Tax=Bipolaris oryzae ATCC 44560 TaxID=930090 RepID=W6ZC77_COCMI|nr:uncharacterized protein COCMIDRAFT_29874 [Bipolaris oryzae ATCC 44560]EUC41336.1 hypothetical protein COCMIDRAFT_29874 [Bipolaris oryzae ATCC 44560]
MATCKTLLRVCPSTVQSATLLPRTQQRFESTTRRHRKLLALPAAPSYTPDTSSPTLIFNPPSSAPSVHHTPLKFLPPTDKRRNLYANTHNQLARTALSTRTSPIASPGTPLSAPSHLPPKPSSALPRPVRTPYAKQYHLTEQQVREMRALRAQDPDTWTRVKLADKFGCSQFFVGLVAKNAAKAERVRQEHEESRAKWGVRRREAREERGRRKAGWGRDE